MADFEINFHKKQGEAVRMLGPSSDIEVLGYGGGKGGGKSHLSRMWQVARRVKYAKSRGLLIRESFPELERTHIDRLKTDLPKTEYSYNDKKHIFTFRNGSTLEMGYCERPDDIKSTYWGAEYDDIVLDEAQNHPKGTFRNLYACLRTTRQDLKARFLCTFNWGGTGHCIPYGNVLTQSGWRPIQDVTVGEMVYSVDKGGNLVLKKVAQTHKNYYDGCLKYTNTRGFTMECTPNHSIAKIGRTRGLAPRKREDVYSLVPCDKLPAKPSILRTITKQWTGNEIKKFEVSWYDGEKKAILKQPHILSGDNYCKFMAWYLSEGCVCSYKTQKRFEISQTKKQNRKIIEELLNSCGFLFRSNNSGFVVFSPIWWNYLQQFKKCRDKFVPEKIKMSCTRQIKLFLDAYCLGDGHRTGSNSFILYTISKQMAYDLMELGIKSGYIVNKHERQRGNRDGLSYEISFKKTKNCGTEILTHQHVYDYKNHNKRQPSLVDKNYKGQVYCIGVEDTHTFIVEQNGSVWVSGNSWLLKMFWRKWMSRNAKPGDEIDTWEHPSHWEEGEDPAKFAFLKALLVDNPSITLNDPNYEARLRLYPEEVQLAYIEGEPMGLEGQFFVEFGPHLKEDPFYVQESDLMGNMFFGSLDSGTTHATVYKHWWISGPAYQHVFGFPYVAHLIFTYKGEGTNLRGHAEEIYSRIAECDFTHGHFPHTIAYDNQMDVKFRANNYSEACALDEYKDVFQGKRTLWRPANKNKINGCQILRMMFANNPTVPLAFRYFSQGNKTFEEDIVTAIKDKNNPEVYAKQDGDDDPDATRYGAIYARELVAGTKQTKHSSEKIRAFNQKQMEKNWKEI